MCNVERLISGYVLKKAPFIAFAAGEGMDVPVLIGDDFLCCLIICQTT